MNGKEMLEIMANIDVDLIQSAAGDPPEKEMKRSKGARLLGLLPKVEKGNHKEEDQVTVELVSTGRPWGRWLAVSLGVVVLCGILVASQVIQYMARSGNRVTPSASSGSYTTEHIPAETYFQHNIDDGDWEFLHNMMADVTEKDVLVEALFGGQRLLLESQQVLPLRSRDQWLTIGADYDDESDAVKALTIRWQRTALGEGFGSYFSDDIILRTAPQPFEGYQGEKYLAQMANKTVVERDGVKITVVGGEGNEKCLTYQRQDGWYQLYGSHNISCEELIEVLDWFWLHPVDYGRFTKEQADEYMGEGQSRNYGAETIDELGPSSSQELPVFAEFCPGPQEKEWCPPELSYDATHQGDEPASIEIEYAHAYENPKPIAGWAVYRRDLDAREGIEPTEAMYSMGDLDEDVTPEVLEDTLRRHHAMVNNKLVFTWKGLYVVATLDDCANAENLWPFLEQMRETRGQLEVVRLYEYEGPDIFEGYYPLGNTQYTDAMSVPELFVRSGQVVELNCEYDWMDQGKLVQSWSVLTDFTSDAYREWFAREYAGDLNTMTQEALAENWNQEKVPNDYNLMFTWDGHYIMARLDPEASADQIWDLLQSLKAAKYPQDTDLLEPASSAAATPEPAQVEVYSDLSQYPEAFHNAYIQDGPVEMDGVTMSGKLYDLTLEAAGGQPLRLTTVYEPGGLVGGMTLIDRAHPALGSLEGWDEVIADFASRSSGPLKALTREDTDRIIQEMEQAESTADGGTHKFVYEWGSYYVEMSFLFVPTPKEFYYALVNELQSAWAMGKDREIGALWASARDALGWQGGAEGPVYEMQVSYNIPTEGIAGDLRTMTKADVEEYLQRAGGDSFFFTWDYAVVRFRYQSGVTAEDLWEFICQLKKTATEEERQDMWAKALELNGYTCATAPLGWVSSINSYVPDPDNPDPDTGLTLNNQLRARFVGDVATVTREDLERYRENYPDQLLSFTWLGEGCVCRQAEGADLDSVWSFLLTLRALSAGEPAVTMDDSLYAAFPDLHGVPAQWAAAVRESAAELMAQRYGIQGFGFEDWRCEELSIQEVSKNRDELIFNAKFLFKVEEGKSYEGWWDDIHGGLDDTLEREGWRATHMGIQIKKVNGRWRQVDEDSQPYVD
ncbi:MAG: hypothetical protein HFE94_06805 [Acutalibacter sp.]|nr:hypothetical protein [Acutalibacter sp.]